MAGRPGSREINGLTPLQREFVFALIECDFNAIAAVKATGSAASTDKARDTIARRWLDHVGVQAAIDEELQARSKRLRIGPDRVVQELAKIAFSNSGDYYEWDDTGSLKITSSRKLTRAQKAAIASVKETVKTRATEDGEVTTRTLEFKQHDKLKALELVGRHIGMFDDRATQQTELTVKIERSAPPDWTDTELP